MKQFVSVCCSLAFLASITFAQRPDSSVFDQLVSINKEWKNQQDVNPSLKEYKALGNLEEVELIQSHLTQTEKLLRARSTTHLTASQRKNRAALLDILHAYRLNGVFPKNTFHTEKTPYFIDIYDTYCAVGFLMKMSGADKMARDINRTQNFSYLKDIKHPALAAWVKNSGFSTRELALIQPAYDCYPTALSEIHYNNLGVDVDEYFEFIQSSPMPGNYNQVTKLEFYDNTNTLYKTVTGASIQSFLAGPGNGPMERVSFRYYVFPANESFADLGVVKAINVTGSVDRTVFAVTYNGSATIVDYYNVYSFSPFLGQIMNTYNYPVGENGSLPAGISINFCSPSCTPGVVSFIPEMLQQTIGTANLNCLRVLPLSLSKFDYAIINGKVQLTWQTPSEINTDRFEIERSTDGTNFSKIGSVNAAVNSSISKSYVFLDPMPGITNYYRLKQVDRDGKAIYSKVLLVRLKVNSPLVLYSPLSRDLLRVGINLNQQEIRALKIYDLAGRFGMGVRAQPGLNEIDISKLPPGVYFIRLETKSGGNFGERLIKQ